MPHSNGYCYNFGPYKFDLANGILTRESAVISLPPKAIEILEVLVKNAGQLIEKDQLMKLVWPDTFVEEANLSQNVFMLRRALGDRRLSPTYIETVTRRGYRFVCPVTRVSCNEGSTDESQMTRRDRDAAMTGLAVLPFANETGDENLEYLADGITETIINNLSRLSRLRVMSRSSVFRYRGRQLDPTEIGQLLGIDALLVGKVALKPSGLVISAELVDAANGWQLWGETFDCKTGDILEIQDEIARRLTAALKLKLTGDEEKKLTTRYTENSEAYKAYLEGRYHWSRYTKASIEKAIVHFRRAIELDQNYALAYSGIVDCYLRLVTNYLPPDLSDDASSDYETEGDSSVKSVDLNNDVRIRLRHEWDWKCVERESIHADEFKTKLPTANQWYAAYMGIRSLFSEMSNRIDLTVSQNEQARNFETIQLPNGIAALQLTRNESVQVLCAVSRDQIDIGNYEAASILLASWWKLGSWPNLNGLTLESSADLLFTCGVLAGCIASSKQVSRGQRHGEALLNASLGLCEQLGFRVRASEIRMELAVCYYRQGFFDLARETLRVAVKSISSEQYYLRGLGLVRLGIVERHAGRLETSHAFLREAEEVIKAAGPWISGRYHQELATTLQDLALSGNADGFYEKALETSKIALNEFEAVGNHRYVAVVQNNFGYLLMCLERYKDAEDQLNRAKRFFSEVGDRVKLAQVSDTLAHLYMVTNRLEESERLIDYAIQILENGDEDALLAEALITKGRVLCQQRRSKEAIPILERAATLSQRCGDYEGAGHALLLLVEEASQKISKSKLGQLRTRLQTFLQNSQRESTRKRLADSLARISDHIERQT